MTKYIWKLKYQTSLGRTVIRNLEITGTRDGRNLSCETPMRAYGNFELSAKKKVPTEVPLPSVSPIYVYYDSIKGIVGDTNNVTNKNYEKINKGAGVFLTKTVHTPLRVFALGMGSTTIRSDYLSNQSSSAIIKATNRYINYPAHQDFEFITIPLYYGYSKEIMNKIIDIGTTTKKELDKPIAGFIDPRDPATFSVFKNIIEDNQSLYSNFDLFLIKWVSPDRHLNDYYFIENLLIKTYSTEKYEDFPPIIMIATQRKSDNTFGISGVHYTHIFGGDLHNVDRIHGFSPTQNTPLNPPSFFDRNELTINPIINEQEIEMLKNHHVVKRYGHLKEILDNPNEWTLSNKHLSSANGLAYMLETYDSPDEFRIEQKYLKTDEIKEYYDQKSILKKKSKNAIYIKSLMRI
ncbi:MAG: hypothetical protein GXO25_04200 [Euryarchaeota archaeon]|nr:hypothetical protein [Euryarchaeota archaeon]